MTNKHCPLLVWSTLVFSFKQLSTVRAHPPAAVEFVGCLCETFYRCEADSSSLTFGLAKKHFNLGKMALNILQIW